MELTVKDTKGKDTKKKVTLTDSIFEVEPSDHAIYLDVKQYLASQRQGTHKTKERWEVSYSTKKIVRQKGSGGARHGSLKAGIFKQGGNIFGPRPRDYGFKLNKKVKQLARKSALTYKAKEGKIIVIEDLTFNSPKTKEYIQILNNLSVSNEKTLLILAESNKNVYLSSRNFKGSKVVLASDINTYDILNAQSILISESSIKTIETTLSEK
ncbi:MAG: 50S ribosomal protein L4 [Flavobacteriales bacterium]|nr:50S ribosomal protein L4 [Flavobacteriales bacterium]